MKPRYIILFIAALVSICSLPLQYLEGEKKKHLVADLVAQCKQENPTPSSELVQFGKPWFGYVCDKVAISSLPYDHQKSPIQSKIHYASNGNNWLEEWGQIVAAAAFFAAIPFAWGFFLARLREVSRAIRGID